MKREGGRRGGKERSEEGGREMDEEGERWVMDQKGKKAERGGGRGRKEGMKMDEERQRWITKIGEVVEGRRTGWQDRSEKK